MDQSGVHARLSLAWIQEPGIFSKGEEIAFKYGVGLEKDPLKAGIAA